ncbi:ricin-type beta-trefoil lectin domain protein [Kineosporia babensis]|uniref:Ricin-type beta-trefoil lectin domain protein n=1 Tax=Kineosporia babensis TaxID=499548 RepID=A0A9X1N8R8_9ACTN|nr:ricin-type beta-trefoil lectin domain protein [Kineosporia babensis]MCD5310607.1 ricin-type beta-trefoil lectin domain protein [Kineosporia babensis]
MNRHIRAAVMLGLAALLGSLAVALGPISPAQASPLASTPLITQNLQGASSGGDTKWTTSVLGHARAAEIVLLQEAGPTPPGKLVANIPMPHLPQIGRAGFVQHHAWRPARERFEVYFLQTDPNGGSYVGNRNNLAIVTQRAADEVAAVPNPTGARPSLGVRFGDDWFFTQHSRAGDDNNARADAENALAAIDQFVNQVPGRRWTVAGDFNIEPNRFNRPPNTQVYSSGEATHINGRELDYAVSSAVIPNHPVRRLNGASPDHFPVAIGALRASAEYQDLFDEPRVLENVQSGGVISTRDRSDKNGTAAVTARRENHATQEWFLEENSSGLVRLHNRTGNCLRISQFEGGHFGTVLDPCTRDVFQQWHLDSVASDQYRLRNYVTGLCLGVGDHRETRLDDFHLGSCNGGLGEEWLLAPPLKHDLEPGISPADLAVSWPSGGLENLFTGQVLNQSDNKAGPHVGIGHRDPRDSTEQQSWRFDWLGNDQVRVRSAEQETCLQQQFQGLVDLAPCGDANDERWQVRMVGEDMLQLASVDMVDGDYACLSATPDERLPDTGFVAHSPCQGNDPTQTWFLSPTVSADERNDQAPSVPTRPSGPAAPATPEMPAGPAEPEAPAGPQEERL